ncbi:N-6 DNA methylase [Burkholderia arboris]|uniref:SNF2-related protein n=1 Tax=Burkholderia arboris TaxID=488730 RepID=UPI001CF24010|nr:SNF2-related protein [Burkholderia arboris]MCA8037044.1 N-6 DNA methylase [Burkholderia arboris]
MSLSLLDDARALANPLLERLKLAKEVALLVKQRRSLSKDNTTDLLASLKIAKRLRELLLALGVRIAAPKPAVVPAGARPTADFYPSEERQTITQRQRANDSAIALLREIQQAGRDVTDDDRATLAKYSGNGGGLIGADGLSGSPHEYYTPKPVADGVWSLLEESGFAGGAVLDPSAGSGIFAATRPASAVMTQVELDATSGAINALVNNSPTSTTTVAPFEAVAAATPDEIYDAVVTNVPFGDLAMRGDNPKKDKRFQRRNLQEYFILRCLQKLKPRGLAAFIVPPSIVSGKGARQAKLRLEASLMAEFVGAYRLPNKIFTESAAADTITDVIVFRKFTAATALKIEELQEQNPAVLSESLVLWDTFLKGQYFKGEGRKFILGETARGMSKFGEVEKVINDDSIANIAKLLRRFPESRINWELLDTTETAPITYTDGDIVHANGQTLEWKDDAWVELDSSQADAADLVDLGARVQRPLDAVNLAVPWAQAERWYDHQTVMGTTMDVPAWMTATYAALRLVSAADKEAWWEAITAGMAVMDLTQEVSSVEPFDYLTAYPVLSERLARVQGYGRKTIAGAARLVKDGLLSIRNARVRGKFTPFWRGEIQANVNAATLTPTQLYEKIKYESADDTQYVPLAKLQEAFTDFDPYQSDDWCISPDGLSVIRASDYYSGSYAEFLRRADADMAQATDADVRAKLARQIEAAKGRINAVDVSKMTFSLFTPHVNNLQKLEFLKQYVSPDIILTTDANGREVFDIAQASLGKYASQDARDEHRTLQRFVKGYLRNQNITTMSRAEDVDLDPAREAALLKRIKELADKTKAQFDAWARASEEIQLALDRKLNAPDALSFVEEPDGTPLDIPNLRVETFRPHGFQYAAVRRFSRNFGGILGFDVGLGKTITALAAAQYAQSIGVKKKTFFIVPNNTLTNWKDESEKAYVDTSDCLYVGLRAGKDGAYKVDNDQVRADLNAIRENRHAKIFMTLEAFKMIPLRDETMDAYVRYLAENDDAYLVSEDDELKKRAAIAADSKALGARDTGEKSGALPYFEDMGVDSLVIDEGHNYKNSKTTSSQFKGAKFLADPAKSQRGLDMQAKAWYVRGLSTRNDGVLSLTATPITNSPLEVYSMLTLAIGEREVNAMYGVTGADSFMAAACDIEEREEENLVGVARPVRVFTGLQNADLLRRLMRTAAVIKTADDVKRDGLKVQIPEADEIATAVDIGPQSMKRILDYKSDYLDAVDALKGEDATPEDKLTASPFNLIRKMTRVINDPELADGVIRFKVDGADAAAVDKAIATFNARKIVEERDAVDPNAAEGDIKIKVAKNFETGESVMKYLTTVRARRASVGSVVELLSVGYKAQEALLKALAANKIEPGVFVSPKLAAMIANFQKEAANPRHLGQAKQIIFCDEIGLHHKIKLAVTQHSGVPGAKIKIVNGVSVGVGDMQDVQDGYNADGDANKYTVIIANKKAEVGNNLQKGTQAIHHLTIGWTPDSIHQRNGRGVRQGNPLDTVSVYHYDAAGTFDAYKRKIVGIKADWIGSLMGGDSSKIVVEGDLSASDYELLASAVGDSLAMERVNDEIAARARRQKEATSRASQVQSLRIIEAQNDWQKRFGVDERGAEQRGFAAWISSKVATATTTSAKLRALKLRHENSESDLMRGRLAKQIDELQGKLATQIEVLAGLDTDSVGMPKPRSEYTALTDAEKASPAYANWKRDLSISQRMKEEAAVGFSARTDAGYSRDDLDAFQSGRAAVVAGQLAVTGTFVEAGGKLMVVTRLAPRGSELYAYDPAADRETALLRLSNPVYTGPAAPGWAALVRRAAAADAATVRGATSGFTAGSTQLFSSFIADVRNVLDVPIPSVSLRTDSFTLRPPYFPFVLSEDAQGADFTTRIRAEQASLIKSYDRYGSVTLNDLRDVGDTADATTDAKYAAIRTYAVAHRLRVSVDDLHAVDYQLSVAGALGTLIGDFFRALPDGIAGAASPEALDEWAVAWFNRGQDYVSVPSLDVALDSRELRRYRQAAMAVDDGKERWYAFPDAERYSIDRKANELIQTAIEGGLLLDEILANAGSRYSSYMPQGFRVHGAALARALFADADGRVELVGPAEQARAAMLLPKSARVYVENWDEAARLALSFVATKWSTVTNWAKTARTARAAAASGEDVPALLARIKDIPGVWSARIGEEDVTKKPDRYSAMYQYKAGSYVLLGITRGSDTFTRVATAGETGLQGRTFDNSTKMFRLTIKSGETSSDGKPVASVANLFQHLGLAATA